MHVRPYLLVTALALWLACSGPARPLPLAGGTPAPAQTLRIASFNIQQLGPKKASSPALMSRLAQIIVGYDLVAVQEIKDRTQRAPRVLLSEVRRRSRDFSLVLSPRSGQQPDDRRSQEQYAYYYRKSRLRPVGEHRLFDDSVHDYFQREPHVARFAVSGSCQSLVLINVHTQPRRALLEIAAIEHVFAWARAQYPRERRFVALGDFNAGCRYASDGELDALPLHGGDYDWVVPHSADTNLAKDRCAYDRIIVAAPEGNLFVDDWGVDRSFDDPAVSDHWPVWAELRFPRGARCGP